jgi:hypothetical protein
MIGHVFKTEADGFFGILTYSNKGTTVLMRVIETTSVRDACVMLAATFAGTFTPADSDTQAWGRTIIKARGAQLLTDM